MRPTAICVARVVRPLPGAPVTNRPPAGRWGKSKMLTALSDHTRLTLRQKPTPDQQAQSVNRDRRINLGRPGEDSRSEEHTSELQSRGHLVCRLLLEKK